ncbi:MAG: VCBS repeat-containing protein [bacterium]
MRLSPRTIMVPLVSLGLLVAGSSLSPAEIVIEYSSGVGVGSSPTDLAAGDLDGDGDLDLVVANIDGDSFTILYNDGSGGFGQRVEQRVPAEHNRPDTVAVGDFNGDGREDLVVGILATLDPITRPLKNPGMMIYLAQADGSYTETFYGFDGGPGFFVPVDWDGDGDLDIAVANLGYIVITGLLGLEVEDGGVGFFFNDGNGVFSDYQQVVYTSGSVSPIEVVDIDGDGDLDIVGTNQGRLDVFTGTLVEFDISIITNDGAGNLSLTDALSCSSMPFCTATMDFDGDGDMDVIGAEQGMATVGGIIPGTASMGYWWGNGAGTFSEEISVATQGVPDVIRAADFDGDGDQDLAVTNEGMDIVSGQLENPALLILENNGDGTFEQVSVLSTGESPHGMAVGDWDGDGDTDIAVSSNANNLISIFLNKSPGVAITDWVLY